jgi:hypothetical protein
MASILFLPVELIDIILDHFHNHDLLSVSRTCNSFYQLATPLLYKSVTFDNPVKILNTKETRHGGIDLFFRSLLNRPQLTTYIRHFTFFGFKNIRIWTLDGTPSPTLNSTEMEAARCFIRRFTHVESSLESVSMDLFNGLWESEFEKGLINSILGLLLLLMPNLESLVLDFDYSHGDRSFPFVGVAMNIGQSLRLFDHLTHVEFSVRGSRYRWYHRYIDILAVPSLFYLPCLTSVKLIRLNPNLFKWHRKEQPSCKTLKSLQCIDSVMSEDTLGLWLQASPNIISLRYYICVVVRPFIPLWVQRGKLGEVLKISRKSLIELDIKVSYGPRVIEEPIFTDFNPIDRVGSFEDFKQLKKLTIPLTFFFGMDANNSPEIKELIPESIVSLHIEDDGATFENWGQWTAHSRDQKFLDFLGDLSTQSSRYPHLQLLGTVFPKDKYHVKIDDPRLIATMEALRIRHGIEFERIFVKPTWDFFPSHFNRLQT